MSPYVYSGKNNLFYPVALKDSYSSWPDDGVEIDEDMYVEYAGPAPEGKVRKPNKKGYPEWVDVPPPTSEQINEYKKNDIISKIETIKTETVFLHLKLLLERISDDERENLKTMIDEIEKLTVELEKIDDAE